MSQGESDLGEIYMAATEECTICHIPRDRHNSPNILHEFCPPGQQAALVKRSQQSRDDQRRNDQGSNGEQRMSSGNPDMILRLALFRAGILKVEDLKTIEEELRISGSAGYAPTNPSSPDL